MMHPLHQALWFAAPVVAAGLVHIVIIKLDALPWLARIPLDGGRVFRGRRVFGSNKTLRGAIVTPLAVIACTLIQAQLSRRHAWAAELSLIDFRSVSPVLWGALLGLGYVLGELPNSFLKRQLDVPPGDAAPGFKGVVFWVLDQVDSLLGILLLLSVFFGPPPLRISVALVAVALVIHPATSLVMVALRLKTRVG